MAHTPGPWKACGDSKCPCRQVWSIPADAPVFTATVDGELAAIGLAHHEWGDSKELIYGTIPVDQQEANARLIASAPEMLEALKKITDEMELADFDPNDTDTWYGRALAIIAKAEGRA